MIIVILSLFLGVHVALEDLHKDKELKTIIKDLVRGSGRSRPPSGEVGIQEKGASDQQKQQQRTHLVNQLNATPQKETLAVS